MAEHPSIIPGMRYHDAKAAIDWLCRAFGFGNVLSYQVKAVGSRTPSSPIGMG